MKIHKAFAIITLLISATLVAGDVSREEKDALDRKSSAEMNIRQIDQGIETGRAAIAAKHRSVVDAFAKEQKLKDMAAQAAQPSTYYPLLEEVGKEIAKLQQEERQLEANVTRLLEDKEKYAAQIRNSDELISRIRKREDIANPRVTPQQK